jgi:hypothetical protein
MLHPARRPRNKNRRKGLRAAGLHKLFCTLVAKRFASDLPARCPFSRHRRTLQTVGLRLRFSKTEPSCPPAPGCATQPSHTIQQFQQEENQSHFHGTRAAPPIPCQDHPVHANNACAFHKSIAEDCGRSGLKRFQLRSHASQIISKDSTPGEFTPRSVLGREDRKSPAPGFRRFP